MIQPRYPIFIPSKNRVDNDTAKLFDRQGVPFQLAVEPQDAEAYTARWGKHRVLTLPENDQGLPYSRNWIFDHAVSRGTSRHWQFDDDVYQFRRIHRGYRLPIEAPVGISIIEDFADQYSNVALASPNTVMFLPVTRGLTVQPFPPFYLNSRCYTVFLINNELPNRFRGPYNEDTDMTLQVLSDGWCTLLVNAVAIRTPMTMEKTGGQTDIYLGDGRLKMSRNLERRWPGVVTTTRRFGRPQHHVAAHWTKFDTPLIRATDPPPRRDYGLRLTGNPSNARLAKLMDEEG